MKTVFQICTQAVASVFSSKTEGRLCGLQTESSTTSLHIILGFICPNSFSQLSSLISLIVLCLTNVPQS